MVFREKTGQGSGLSQPFMKGYRA